MHKRLHSLPGPPGHLRPHARLQEAKEWTEGAPRPTPVPGPAARLSRLPRLRATFRLQVACCQHVSLFGLFFFLFFKFYYGDIGQRNPVSSVQFSREACVYCTVCSRPQLGFFLSPPI